MAVEQFHVLDNVGLYSFAAEVFRLVEDTYVRRTTYNAAVGALSERVTILELLDTYECEIDSNGNLVFHIPQEDTVDMEINSSGYLILNSSDTTADRALEHYSFNIGSDGNLYLTVDVSQSS